MSSTSRYRFVSSYRGQGDYVRRADGQRYTIHHSDPWTLYNAGGWMPRPDLAEDWHAHRVEELRELTSWLAARGWTIAPDIRALFPDVADAELVAS